jgi:osmotically-inducible protein OsmY
MPPALTAGMKTRTSLLGATVVAALLLLLLPTPSKADTSASVDITPRLQQAGLDIDDLRGIEIGGIVILRGKALDQASAARAGVYVTQLGYNRVANLIQVVTPPDDAQIERMAERKLGLQRSLDGCKLRVDSNHGVVTLQGTVNSELQKDVAMDIVRNIDGVRAVKAGFRD